MFEPFARPFGCLSDFDRSRIAALLIAPALTTTKSAENSTISPLRSTITLRTSRPLALVSSRTTFEFGASVTFGYSRAGSTQIVCESDFALTRQWCPSQVAQRMHGL